MTNQQLAMAFLERFAAGDVDGLEALLHQRVRVSGPFLSEQSRAAYLQSLRADPPVPADLTVVSLTEDESHVAVFYDYSKGSVTTRVAQLFTCEGQLITEIDIVFDASQPV